MLDGKDDAYLMLEIIEKSGYENDLSDLKPIPRDPFERMRDDVEYSVEDGKINGIVYHLQIPSLEEDDGYPKPLIVYIPGKDAWGTDQAVFSAIENQETRFNGYSLVLGNYGVAPADLTKAIDILCTQYNIDKSNIELVGFSAGAATAITVTNETNGYFKKTTVVSCGAPEIAKLENIKNEDKTKMVGVVGESKSADGAYTPMTTIFAARFDVKIIEGANHSIAENGVVQRLLKDDDDGDGKSDFLNGCE